MYVAAKPKLGALGNGWYSDIWVGELLLSEINTSKWHDIFFI